MSTIIKNFLATVEPFCRLPEIELESLARGSREIEQGKGETIYSEGEEAQSVWILKSGRLDIFKYSSDGKPAAIETINPKGIYGMYCRIGNPECAYSCTAMAAV